MGEIGGVISNARKKEPLSSDQVGEEMRREGKGREIRRRKISVERTRRKGRG